MKVVDIQKFIMQQRLHHLVHYRIGFCNIQKITPNSCNFYLMKNNLQDNPEVIDLTDEGQSDYVYKLAKDVLKEGETIDVKLIAVDPKTGKLKLSRKVLLEKPTKQEA